MSENNINPESLGYYTGEEYKEVQLDKIYGKPIPSLRNLAIELKGLIQKDYILFININLKQRETETDLRQSCLGIELLIWLRLFDVKNHCIVFSFETFESIVKRNTRNFVLGARGTSYFRLPFDFNQINFNKFKGPSSDDNNLRDHLRIIFDDVKMRHENANWWGIVCLSDVLKENNPEVTYINNENYPGYVPDKLEILNNAIALFLFKKSPLSIQQELLKKTKQKIISNDDIINSFVAKNNYVSQYPGYSESERSEKIVKNVKDKNLIHSENDDLKLRKDSLEKSIPDYKINETIFRAKDSFKILCIDDQAADGWAEIYQLMFWGERKPTTFDVISDIPLDNITLFQIVVSKVTEFNPSIIMLDLRLRKEPDSDLIPVGYNVLEFIVSNFPHIPVLVTTASNKTLHYTRLLKAGAHNVWIKEGIDNHFSPKETVRNFLILLHNIDVFQSELYRIWYNLSKFNSRSFLETLWFDKSQNNKWQNGDLIMGDSEYVQNILTESLILLKQYLQEFHLDEPADTIVGQRKESFYLSSILAKLHSIIEHIHDLPAGGEVYTKHGDIEAKELSSTRGTAAHHTFTNITQNIFESYIKNFLGYLEKKPDLYHLSKQTRVKLTETSTFDYPYISDVVIEHLNKSDENKCNLQKGALVKVVFVHSKPPQTFIDNFRKTKFALLKAKGASLLVHYNQTNKHFYTTISLDSFQKS